MVLPPSEAKSCSVSRYWLDIEMDREGTVVGCVDDAAVVVVPVAPADEEEEAGVE